MIGITANRYINLYFIKMSFPLNSFSFQIKINRFLTLKNNFKVVPREGPVVDLIYNKQWIGQESVIVLNSNPALMPIGLTMMCVF